MNEMYDGSWSQKIMLFDATKEIQILKKKIKMEPHSDGQGRLPLSDYWLLSLSLSYTLSTEIVIMYFCECPLSS